jgi:hypothetical protein
MQGNKKLTFRISGKNDLGEQITPRNFDISKAKELIEDIEKFIFAGELSLRKNQGIVGFEYEEGSIKPTVLLPIVLFNLIATDLNTVQKENNLNNIEPARAKIIQKWQENYAKQGMTIEIGEKDSKPIIQINQNTKYTLPEDKWIDTELILYGYLEDIGGAKPNIHLRPENGDRSLIIEATEDQIVDLQKKVTLYRQIVGVQISARQNIITEELKNCKFKDILLYSHELNREKLNQSIKMSSESWKDVPSSIEWTRSFLRA